MNAAVGLGFGVILVVCFLGLAVGVPLLLFWIATRGRHAPGPRFLGVCWRLAQKRGVAVGKVRVLAALAIILSGIVPGLIVYLLLPSSWSSGRARSSRQRRRCRRSRSATFGRRLCSARPPGPPASVAIGLPA
jgi:hypothetical protein